MRRIKQRAAHADDHMMSVFPFAVITWDLDAVLGIFGPLVTSIAVLLAGLLLKQRIRSFGAALLVVGAAGVVSPPRGSRSGSTSTRTSSEVKHQRSLHSFPPGIGQRAGSVATGNGWRTTDADNLPGGWFLTFQKGGFTAAATFWRHELYDCEGDRTPEEDERCFNGLRLLRH